LKVLSVYRHGRVFRFFDFLDVEVFGQSLPEVSCWICHTQPLIDPHFKIVLTKDLTFMRMRTR
jgi:hypothetical protein